MIPPDSGAPTIVRLKQLQELQNRSCDDQRLPHRHVTSIGDQTSAPGSSLPLHRRALGAGVALNPFERSFAHRSVKPSSVCRASARPTSSGDGKPCEGQLGPFTSTRLQPCRFVNPNSSDQYVEYNWNDLNGDRVFQSGEQGVEVGRAGGTAGAAIDPNLVNPYSDEASFFVERAVLADLGVRAGFVWKKDSDGWQRLNASRRYENSPPGDRRSGPDGSPPQLRHGPASTAEPGRREPAANSDRDSARLRGHYNRRG